MSDLFTLSCPSCGAKLGLTDDIQRFACAHCGTEHIVRRGGGIIALVPVLESLHAIRQGTDQTALELRMQRLRHEIGDAEDRVRKLVPQLVQRDIKKAGAALHSIRKISFAAFIKQEPDLSAMEENSKIVLSLTSKELTAYLSAYLETFWLQSRKYKAAKADLETIAALKAEIEAKRAEVNELRQRLS